MPRPNPAVTSFARAIPQRRRWLAALIAVAVALSVIFAQAAPIPVARAQADQSGS